MTSANEADGKRGRTRWLAVAVRVALLGVVVWLIATHINVAEVKQALQRLRPVYLVPILLVLSPLAVVLRALRWRVLLPGGEQIPLMTYVRAYLIGMLANSLLLGRFGDLVKAKAICNEQVNYGRSVAVVVVDRLVEGMALMLLFMVALLVTPMPAWARQLEWIGVGICGGALVFLSLLFRHRGAYLKRQEKVLARLPGKLGNWLHAASMRLVEGCEALTDTKRVAIALLYGVGVWVVEVAAASLFLHAFSVPAPLAAAAIVVLVVLNFGMLVPISPGAVGVYQLLVVFSLSIWGVNRELGFAVGLAMQTVLFLPLYLGGLAALLWAWARERKSIPAAVAHNSMK